MRWTAFLLAALLIAGGIAGYSMWHSAHKPLGDNDMVLVASTNADAAQVALDGDITSYKSLLDELPKVFELYRAHPHRTYDGHDMRQVLKDLADTLDPYQRDMVNQIDRELN